MDGVLGSANTGSQTSRNQVNSFWDVLAMIADGGGYCRGAGSEVSGWIKTFPALQTH